MSSKEFIDTINDIIALTQKGYISWCPTYKPNEYRINIGNAIMSISYSKEQESENYTLKILNLSGDVLKTQVDDLENEGVKKISQLYTAAQESYLKCNEILDSIGEIVKEMKKKFMSVHPSSQSKSNGSEQ